MNRFVATTQHLLRTIFLFVLLHVSDVYSQISVSPESPSETDSLVIEVTDLCLHSPVTVYSSSVVVSQGSIQLFASAYGGWQDAVEEFTVTYTLAPLTAGAYEIQYSFTGGCHQGQNPVFTHELIVLPSEVYTGPETWGNVKSRFRQQE